MQHTDNEAPTQLQAQPQFHALTGQILLGCLVPRPILGRARRLLEGSRGVWGGGPKETSEK